MTIESMDIPFAPRLVHRVRLSQRVFGPGFEALSSVLVPDGSPSRIALFVDSGVATPSRLSEMVEAVKRIALAAPGKLEFAIDPVIVPGGEAVKNDPALVASMVADMHRAGLCRRSYAIAVGGGAVLDAVGFAAAQAHRGVRLVRVPTTTLAQADSCVAVKCGINSFGQKNYLGVFAAPWAVVIDPTLLETLSERDWRSGFSEAVKVALIKDRPLFEQLQREAPAIVRREMNAAWPVIWRSAELHLRHITDGGDAFELTEARPLDFGHWAAHRLEAMTQHRLRHGEAVSIGIAIDTEYSRRAGLLSSQDRDSIFNVLAQLGLPLGDHALGDVDAVLIGLDQFREHLGGRLTVCILTGLGSSRDVHTIDSSIMRAAIHSCAERSEATYRRPG